MELLDLHLDRIARHDGAINAVVARDFDAARKRAKALDRKGSPIGPLHGVPMSVKESFDVAGLPTTWGVPEKLAQIATTDALAVERLRGAGAIITGKTNVPRMLADWQSFNDVYGVTNNPWDVTRGPGGSSGGSAAAVAMGFSALELGSDIAGSLRQPAHACGIFAHKPSWGLLPLRGHSPMPGTAAATDISVIGPLARSAEDLSLMLDLLCQPDPQDSAAHIRLPPPRAKTPRGLRVAVWASDPATPTDPEITRALLDLGRALEHAGAEVSTTARPAFDPRTAFEIFLKLLSAALSSRGSPADLAAKWDLAAALAPDDQSADATVLRAANMSHGVWLGLHEQRCRMRRIWTAFFQDWDVLLCPPHALPALPHRHDLPTSQLTLEVDGVTIPWNDAMFWPGVIGGAHLPATVAPLGRTGAGLPIGVQIVGGLHEDRTTIAVAAMLESLGHRFVVPPGWG